MITRKTLHNKERNFHDEWASSTELNEIRVNDFFETPTAMENQFILKQIGPLKGKKVLDVGCGLGESSVYFALQGAVVTASDISPEMVNLTKRLAEKHKVELETRVASAEELSENPDQFDVIYVANLLHHIEDKEVFLKNMHKCLKAGGVFCSWDPLKYNPIINIYRMIATDVRTEDEMPLGKKEVELIKGPFDECKVGYFWLSSLLLFIKYAVVDRKNPNKVRYWKEIYKENDHSLKWWSFFKSLDRLLSRVPGLDWLCWNIAIVARKGN